MSHDDQAVPGHDPSDVPGGDPSAARGAGSGPATTSGHGDTREKTGSVEEAAAKLFGVLFGWARDQARHDDAGTHGHPGHGPSGGHAGHGGDPGLGPTMQDCRWCPVCRAAHLAHQTSPEVKLHLAKAASSLVQAAAGLLATPAGEHQGQQAQKVDLDDGPEWDEDQ